ncbi:MULTISPECIES: DUF881 domain-containing protein [Nocardioides]|uniref:DUF881 domain-containing protein n=1 Tax=Nocardioides vastitatis TaxID=2568655 RepID=A0ABW0ZIY5_9ACTN|nr:DUF881 domain-containing protein [Nocardioides sp.]THI96622.1 DUF881 domain-containing protein [Nocardioides sp.]
MNDNLDRSRTPLLALITAEALDRDYQVAASRKGPDEHTRASSRTAVVLVVAAFAMLVTVAAVQTSRNADTEDASRASLIDRIGARRAMVAGLQDEVARLREDNTTAQNEVRRLGERYSAVQARRAQLGALTGFTRVTGDGVRISLDNAEFADPNAQLRDSDLALLVDGLWAAGAEAIAINGQRLTSMSAIRNSGLAIEVNSIGIAPPYTVTAIGNPRTLAADLLETPSGLAFVSLASQYGFRYDIDNVTDIRLPAGPGKLRELRSARYDQDIRKNQGGGTP